MSGSLVTNQLLFVAIPIVFIALFACLWCCLAKRRPPAAERYTQYPDEIVISNV